MFTSIGDFLKTWDTETRSTLKVFRTLTDESLHTPVAPGFRTLGDLAAHMVQATARMPAHAGVPLTVHKPDATSAKSLVKEYETTANELAAAIRDSWKDDKLQEQIRLFGRIWSGDMVLSSLLLHQAHHRGQMTVLMRQAGLKVPGIYGPSKEEQEAFLAAQKPASAS
jgi:uncharacterized damage-inducible protein DinB